MSTSYHTVFATLLGRQPLAIGNSFQFFLKEKPDFTIKYVIIMGSKESLNLLKNEENPEEWVKKNIEDAEKHFGLKNLSKEVIVNSFEVSEYDIEKIASRIFERLKREVEKNNEDIENIVIDITGGRKAMSIGGFIAAHSLEKYFETKKNIYLMYYWLKDFSEEKKVKKAWELFDDDYKIKIWRPTEIIE